MKNHESFMNLVEQVSSSGGDETWNDVPDLQEDETLRKDEVGEEELKEDSGLLSDKDAPKRRKQHVGVTLGCFSVFISMVGASFTFPFMQSQRDSLGCDALCYGSMMSARSAMSLIGSVLVGRMSDKIGRIRVLWIGLISSIVSYYIGYSVPTIEGMWLAMIPSSLLNQNYSVLKALFTDYNNEDVDRHRTTESERASQMGRLGMAVGIAFMVGPALGATVFKSYNDATLAAMCLAVCSCILLTQLPMPRAGKGVSSTNDGENKKSKSLEGIWSYIMLPASRTWGAWLLFFMRGSMGIAYHVFATIWTVTLKQRFDFGPKDHAYFMGWVGLWYALSQGVFAKKFIKYAGEDPTNVILACVVILALGRVLAMMTSSLFTVYGVMATVIVALGIMNTSISSACSNLADPSEIGGLFGILEAVESTAGLVGPAVGGMLHRLGPSVPLYSVVVIYGAIFVAVLAGYRNHIVKYGASREKAGKLE